MKILLLGKNGQVGWELQRALQPLGEIIALDRHIAPVIGISGNVSNAQHMQTLFEKIKPQIVVNATAYTAVDKAETEQDQADLINHISIDILAQLAHQHNSLLIHYSTDYVFPGTSNKPWLEDDAISPVNYYGQTKRAGEVVLENSKVNFLNFRTSWVYGTHGHNFIKTMLKLAQTKDELSIIDDQIGAPTSASLIADITAHAIRYYIDNPQKQTHLHGHYHLAPAGEVSWFDYANFIFAIAREKGLELKIKQVHKIKTADYPTPAQRPLNSRLNTQKIRTNFKVHLPQWQQGVEHTLGQII